MKRRGEKNENKKEEGIKFESHTQTYSKKNNSGKVAKSTVTQIRSEIDGVLWLISLLSRVDGLILMNEHLIVR